MENKGGEVGGQLDTIIIWQRRGLESASGEEDCNERTLLLVPEPPLAAAAPIVWPQRRRAILFARSQMPRKIPCCRPLTAAAAATGRGQPLHSSARPHFWQRRRRRAFLRKRQRPESCEGPPRAQGLQAAREGVGSGGGGSTRERAGPIGIARSRLGPGTFGGTRPLSVSTARRPRAGRRVAAGPNWPSELAPSIGRALGTAIYSLSCCARLQGLNLARLAPTCRGITSAQHATSRNKTRVCTVNIGRAGRAGPRG